MEHRRPNSSSSEVSRHIHDCKSDHTITIENVRILDREPSWFERGQGGFLHPCTKTGAKPHGNHTVKLSSKIVESFCTG
ncbi:hypothetical protein DPMN_181254 [Dreissena polymorpha]|uniref:Uncharacterized protein n=1 Tax=Dreissena polymorpha TaxID=45954 RepID=A0A9D4DC01_DREPO|nr:hypothetical protein DPMN_181254 [Dreissena polymorpha]